MASWKRIGGTVLVGFSGLNGLAQSLPSATSVWEVIGALIGVSVLCGGLIYWIWTHDRSGEGEANPETHEFSWE